MPVAEITPEVVLGERSNYDKQVELDPTVGELAHAYFEDGNTINGIANKITALSTNYDPEPDYDVFGDIHGYEGFAHNFIGVESRREADAIKQRIDTETENKNVMAAGGAKGLAVGLAVGLVDPINLIPVGGTAYKTYRTGGRVLDGALRTAAAGGLAATASEAILQGAQETRTAEESSMNIAAVTLLSGILGAAGARVGGHIEMNALATRLDEELRVPIDDNSSKGSVGAAVVPETSLDQETLKSAFGLEKYLAFQDPVLRTLNSPSKLVRQLSEQLAETALTKNKNTEGIASQISVENLLKGYDSVKYNFFKNLDEQFLLHRQSTSKYATRLGDTFKRSRKDGKLTYNEFGEEVVKAARRGDTHEIPEVAAAAKSLRRDLFDPIFKNGVEAGIFDEEELVTKTAPSYVTRLWNNVKIRADLPKFKAQNEEWLRFKRDGDVVSYNDFLKENDAAIKEAQTLEKQKIDTSAEYNEFRKKNFGKISQKDEATLAKLDELKKKFDEGQKAFKDTHQELLDEMEKLRFRASATDADIASTVDRLTDRILGSPGGRLQYDNKIEVGRPASGTPGVRGAAKARVYDIPDAMVEDFLTNDIGSIVQAYVHSLGADIELKKKFGSLDMASQRQDIANDYARLMSGANAEMQRALQKAKESDLADMDAMVQRLRGVYGHNPGDDYASAMNVAQRVAMNWNYLTSLGGMTVSAFPDIVRPVMEHGLTRVFGDGFMAMATDWKGFKAAAEEIKEAGTALDMAIDTRARALSGFDDYVPFTNRAEAVIGRMAHDFGVVSLMSPWNATMKQFSGVITQSRFLRATLKLAEDGKLPAAETENLAANFIDKKMALRIAEQYKKHGSKEGNVFVPNARQWDDIQAQKTFRAAIRRQVDKIIVTPGQDKPLWLSKSGWKLLGQFRSFAFASTQKAMLSGLQQRDMAVLNGVILSGMLGTASYIVKSKAAGYEPDYSMSTLVREGIDRSGLTGWLSDANNIVEKVSRGRVGMSAVFGGPQMSRYASRSVLESVFGPTYGMLGNVSQIVGNAAAGDWQSSDTHTVRRLMPYQNLIYVRGIFDEAESSINEFFGVPNK